MRYPKYWLCFVWLVSQGVENRRQNDWVNHDYKLPHESDHGDNNNGQTQEGKLQNQNSRDHRNLFENIRMSLPENSFTQEKPYDEDGISNILLINLTVKNAELSLIQKDKLFVSLDAVLSFVTKTQQEDDTSHPTQTQQQHRQRTMSAVNASYMLPNLTANITFSQKVDNDFVSNLRHHSLNVKNDDILSCLLNCSYDAQNPNISLSYEEGSFTPVNTDSTTVTSHDNLYNSLILPSPYNINVPFFANAFLRSAINNAITSIIAEKICPLTITSSCGIFLDFRDLFLPPKESIKIGGTGEQPYYDIGQLFYHVIRQSLQPVNHANLIQLNEALIRIITAGGMVKYPGSFYIDQNSSDLLRPVFSEYNFTIDNITIENLDTLVYPTQVLHPMAFQPFTLGNELIFGPNLTASFTLKISMVTNSNPPHAKDFEIHVSFPVESLESFSNITAMIPVSEFVKMPVQDMGNLFCWLAMISASYLDENGNSTMNEMDVPFGLTSFVTTITGLSMGVDCLNCTTNLTNILNRFMDYYNYESEILNLLENRLDTLFEEIMLSNKLQRYFDTLAFDSRKLCPHRPEYDIFAVSSLRQQSQAPKVPKLSLRSLDTVIFCVLMGVQLSSFLFGEFIAESYDSLQESNTSAPLNTSRVPTPQDLALVDFTDKTTFSWMLGKLRDNFSSDPSLIKPILTFLQEKLLDLLIQQPNVTDSFFGIDIQFKDIEWSGFNTLKNMTLFEVFAPQMLNNKVSLEYLNATIHISVAIPASNDPPIDIALTFAFNDLDISLPLVLAIKETTFYEIQVGSLVWVEDLLSCLMSVAHTIRFSGLNYEFGSFQFSLNGMLPDTSSNFSRSMEFFKNHTQSRISDAWHKISISFFQNRANDLLRAYISMATMCPIPHSDKKVSYVDFKQMLSDPGSADKETDPYGDLFHKVWIFLNETVFAMDNTTDMPKVNNYIKAVSNEGSISIPGKKKFSLDLDDVLMLEIALSALSFANLDSIGAPMMLMEPNVTENDTHLLSNKISLGVGQPFRLSLSGFFSLKGMLLGDLYNEIQFDFDLYDLVAHVVMLVKLRADLLLSFSLEKMLLSSCWSHLFITFPGGPGKEQALGFEYMDIALRRIGFNMTCLNCTSVAVQAFANSVGKLDKVFNVLFVRIATLVMQHVETLFNTGMIDLMMYERAKECNGTSVLPDEPDTRNLPAASPLSPESVETLAFASFVCCYLILYIIGGEHAHYKFSKSDPLAAQNALNVTNSSNLVNLTLSATLGDLVSRINRYLSSPVLDPETNKTIMQVNKVTRKLMADKNVVAFGINEAWDSLIWSIGVLDMKIRGLDSYNKFNFYSELGPQTVQSQVGWDEIILEIEFEIKANSTKVKNASSSSYYQDYWQGLIPAEEMSVPFTISFALRNVSLTTSIFAGIGEEKVKDVKLGPLLLTPVSCLLNISDVLQLTQFLATATTVGSIDLADNNRKGGFQSEDIRNAAQDLLRILTEEFGESMKTSLPALTDLSIRKFLNGVVSGLLGSEYSKCEYPHPDASAAKDITIPTDDYNGENFDLEYTVKHSSSNIKFVDLRDLFLSEGDSRWYGGTGLSPFGYMVSQLLVIVNDIVESVNQTGFSRINDFLFAYEDLLAHDFYFPDDIVSIRKNISHKDLDAFFGVSISNVTIHGIDTIGKPSKLLDMTKDKPYQVNNTITVGAGGRPVRVRARIKIHIQFGADKIKNDFDFSFDFYNASLNIDGFVKIDEKRFIEFPMRDCTNVFCWVATIPPAVQSNAGLTRLLLSVGEIGLNAFCYDSDCTNQKLKEYRPLQDLSSGLSDHVNDLFDYFIHKHGNVFLQNFIDRAIHFAPKRCPHHPDFDNRSGSESVWTDLYDSYRVDESRLSNNYFSRELKVLSAVGLLVLFSPIAFEILLRIRVREQYKKLYTKLSRQSLDDIQRFDILRREIVGEILEREINNTAPCMFCTDFVMPLYIRCLIPILIVINMCLYIVCHISTAGSTDLHIEFMEESVSAKEFFKFTTWSATNLGASAAMAFSFSFVWPYAKLLVTFCLWFLPPRFVSASTRGSILIWFDKLAKWSMLGIMSMIIGFVALSSQIGIRTILSIDFFILPSTGIYANLVAHLLSQIVGRVILHYDRKIHHRARIMLQQQQLYKPRSMDTVVNSYGASTLVDDSDPNQHDDEHHDVPLDEDVGKDRLCNHAFVSPHGDPSDKLLIRHHVNVSVVFFLMILCSLLIMSCILPFISFEYSGFIGFLKELGSVWNNQATEDVYSIFDVATVVFFNEKVLGTSQAYFGHLLLSAVILIFVVFVPFFQIFSLAFLWFCPLTFRQKRRLFALTEFLQSWSYTEVLFFAIILVTWQFESVSNFFLDDIMDTGRCSGNIVESVFLRGENALCFFQRIPQIQVGCSLMIPFMFLFSLFHLFVTKAAMQYFQEIDPDEYVRYF